MIELTLNCGKLSSVVINEIVSFTQKTYYNQFSGHTGISFTEVVLKNGHIINANIEAYDLIKKFKLQSDLYWNL